MTTNYEAFPIVIVEDRYSGVYSGYKWLVFARFDETINMSEDMENGVWGDDVEAATWFAENGHRYWGGSTPDEALANFRRHYPESQEHTDSFVYTGSKAGKQSVAQPPAGSTVDASLGDPNEIFYSDELSI